MDRADVYKAIDSERDYQDRKWGNGMARPQHSPDEWCLYIQDYLNEATHILSRMPDAVATPAAMEIMRKIGGMAVKCMEEHGTTLRPADAEIMYDMRGKS